MRPKVYPPRYIVVDERESWILWIATRISISYN